MQARNVHAPQLGFNNNVKHNGRVFHIQTEDSGIHHPHITTHLFADGGRILRTERTDYRELLNSPDLVAQLRARMKEQHRAMFTALRQGQLDHLIDTGATKGSGSQSVAPAVRGARSNPPKVSTPLPARVAARTSVSDRTPAPGRVTPTPARAARSVPPRNSTTQARASGAPKAKGQSRPQNPKPERPQAPSLPASTADKSSHSSSGGHDAVRPSLPGGNSMSLFGSPKVSEQSLDDIILSYISEDLESE